jgi:hypothetical protein
MWFKKNKWKGIIPFLVLVLLAAVFYFGGNAPGSKGWTVSAPVTMVSPSPTAPTAQQTASPSESEKPFKTPEPSGMVTPTKEPGKAAEPTTEPTATIEPTATPKPIPESTPEPTMVINPKTGKDLYRTDPVPDGMPLPVEPQDVVVGSQAYTCTLSICCSTILDNMGLCNPEKVELVPEDGWILEPTLVTFYEGESVFNVLQRTCKQLAIHMEYENTPIYNSAYIEGIHNLYEFDVGELSGWMYKVNAWFPNYGCSRYQLKDGDVICWCYTCDLGYDVGGGYAFGQ